MIQEGTQTLWMEEPGCETSIQQQSTNVDETYSKNVTSVVEAGLVLDEWNAGNAIAWLDD